MRSYSSRRARVGLTVTDFLADDKDGTKCAVCFSSSFSGGCNNQAVQRVLREMVTKKWSRSSAGGLGTDCLPVCSSSEPSNST